MINETSSLKRTARITGVLYFLLSLGGIYTLEYVPSLIYVQGDDAATCRNILSHEFLFRTGIATDLVTNTFYIFLAFMFFRLFKDVNEQLARLLVVLVLVQIPIVVILDSLNITTLLILKGEEVKNLTAQQTQDFAMLVRRIRGNGMGILEVFWGLWLFPMGWLSYKSGFIPRIVGVLVIITGFAYLFDSFIFMLLPAYADVVDKYIFPFYMGELSIVFWLLIRGVKKGY